MERQRFKVTEIYTKGDTFTKYMGKQTESEDEVDGPFNL